MRRSRSRSLSRSRKGRKASRSRSRSIDRPWSSSKRNRQRSRSRSPPRKAWYRRSRSRSPSRPKKWDRYGSRSRSRSITRRNKRRSRSRSLSKRNRQRSRSLSKSRKSYRRSRSRSASLSKRSKVRRRSKSKSPRRGRYSRSRSASKDIRRSRSRSDSRSNYKVTKPRSRSKSNQSRSRSRSLSKSKLLTSKLGRSRSRSRSQPKKDFDENLTSPKQTANITNPTPVETPTPKTKAQLLLAQKMAEHNEKKEKTDIVVPEKPHHEVSAEETDGDVNWSRAMTPRDSGDTGSDRKALNKQMEYTEVEKSPEQFGDLMKKLSSYYEFEENTSEGEMQERKGADVERRVTRGSAKVKLDDKRKTLKDSLYSDEDSDLYPSPDAKPSKQKKRSTEGSRHVEPVRTSKRRKVRGYSSSEDSEDNVVAPDRRKKLVDVDDSDEDEYTKTRSKHRSPKGYEDDSEMKSYRSTRSGRAGRKEVTVHDTIVGFVSKSIAVKFDVKSVIKNYRIPINCLDLKPPSVSSKIKRLLPGRCSFINKKLLFCHKWFARGVVPIIEQVALFGTTTQKIPEVCSRATDSITLLGYVCFTISVVRRQLLEDSLPTELQILCEPSNSITENLFGDDVAHDIEMIRSMKYKPSDSPIKLFSLPSSDYGAEIDSNVATMVNMSSVNDANTDDLRDKYRIPVNCKSMKPPKVNPEMAKFLPPFNVELDLQLAKLHQGVAEGMVPALLLLQAVQQDKYDDCLGLNLLTDAIAILCNNVYQWNALRMEQMKLNLPSNIQNQLHWGDGSGDSP